MDIQAAETSYKKDPRDQISYTKKSWHCRCAGCAKAVKQERERILEEIDKLDTTKLNGLGMKILVKEIIGINDKKGKKK